MTSSTDSTNLTDKEKATLDALNKSKENVQQAENTGTQADSKSVSSGTIIVITQNLFHNLAVMVNPVWELSQPEAKSLVESLDAAYPTIDLGKFAKIFFWFNVTMLFAPRVIITLRDLARKGKAKSEVGTNPG